MKYLENAIRRLDARNLTKYVRSNSVTLTVTSPPYRNAIDYDQHISNMTNSESEWMRGVGEETTEAYLDTMQRIFDQVFVVTKDGGFCCIVIGDEVVNGKLIALPSLLLSRLANCETEDDPSKWRLRDMIIWHKVTSGRNGSGNRCGMFIKMPYPGYYRANIMHEYILVLQKGMPAHGAAKRIPLNRVIKREVANSIWNIAPVPPGMTDHPVPFPEQIPWRLATLLTKPGDIILDPMNGSGQTTKVAHKMGRRYLGFDIQKEYVQEARKRLREDLRLGNHLTPVFIKESWSDHIEDGSFLTTEVDMSSHIPNGYRLTHKTESEKAIRGERGVYAYFVNNESKYMCLIVGSRKHYRLNIGSVNDRNSMLGQVLHKLPQGEFIKADLNDVLQTRIVENRQPVKACIDVLMHLGYVGPTTKKGSRQFYKLTESGISLQQSRRKL